jgi:hypothetical protein
MREIARVAQGYFPTQPRIVSAIAQLFDLPRHGTLTVLDAGCGCGDAIFDLRAAWAPRLTSELKVMLYGIESDRERHSRAQKRLLETGGEAVWSSIEDCGVDRGASLLWFNPPYDRIRGGGRTELALFNQVKTWCRRDGILVLIVPDYILSDSETELATAIERSFRTLEVYRYPEPEYRQFKQCIVIAQRRDKALNSNRIAFPEWAADPEHWPILPDHSGTIATLGTGESLQIRRTTLCDEIIGHVLSGSPLRNSLLREALAPAASIERPLLPLKAGHLALALAGGLCDGVVEKDGLRFLVKGTLSRKTCQTKTTEKHDADGKKIADVDIFRTVYAMNVRCLRTDGIIEDYTSNDGEDVASGAADKEDADE